MHTVNTHHLVLQLLAAEILCFIVVPIEVEVGLGRVEFHLNVVVREENNVRRTPRVLGGHIFAALS